MNIAVLHPTLEESGGGARVALTMAEAFDADLFVTRYDADRTYSGFENVSVREITLSPSFRSLPYPIWKSLAALGFLNLDLSGNDFVWLSGALPLLGTHISENSAYYCHSPPRELYEKNYRNPIRRMWVSFWRYMDRNSASEPDKIVASSQRTKWLVKEFYDRDPLVVYPPVDTERFTHKKPDGYWLSVQRISPVKRLEIQLEAFRNLPDERLVMAGGTASGVNDGYVRRFKEEVKNTANVDWVGEKHGEDLVDLYSRCKGVVQTGRDESAPAVPVEAMASGKPCIAPNEGGFRDTIVPGETGELIDRPYKQNLVRTIRSFDGENYDFKKCQERAEEFSKDEFVLKIGDVTRRCLS